MNFYQFFAFSSQNVTSFGLKYVLMGKPEDWLAHKGGFFVKWERPSKGGPKTASHELVPTSLPISSQLVPMSLSKCPVGLHKSW